MRKKPININQLYNLLIILAYWKNVKQIYKLYKHVHIDITIITEITDWPEKRLFFKEILEWLVIQKSFSEGHRST